MNPPSNQLQKQIINSFNAEELRTLCFDLGIDYDDLPAKGRVSKSRELVHLLERNGRIEELIHLCQVQRPHVSWQPEDLPVHHKCPYKGLAHFNEKDVDRFFGREQLVSKLTSKVFDNEFLAIIGASGAGKSSIVEAGLIPEIRRQTSWPIHLITPTSRPLESLAISFTRYAESVTATATLVDDLFKDRRSLDLYLQKLQTESKLTTLDKNREEYQRYLTMLRQKMIANLSITDLRDACFKLAIDYDLLPARSFEGKAREILSYLDRRNRINELILILRSANTNANWDLPPSQGVKESNIGHEFAKRYGNRFLLVIDEFEELFTSCHDEIERSAFIDNLIYATTTKRTLVVVIVLRTDFYSNLFRYRKLAEVFEDHQVSIPPMNESELRHVVLEPARQAGLTFEKGLIELILSDTTDELEVLPLLSLALAETCELRKGNQLTISGYQKIGGVQRAIAAKANATFSQLPTHQQQIARNIFLQLVSAHDDSSQQPISRRTPKIELVRGKKNADHIEQVLSELINSRLLSINGDNVEIIHDALIKEWPTFQHWINEQKEFLLFLSQLRKDALAWQDNNQDSSYLYRGARLESALSWLMSNEDYFNNSELEFLDASKQAKDFGIFHRFGRTLSRSRMAIVEIARSLHDATQNFRNAEATWAKCTDVEQLILLCIPPRKKFGTDEVERLVANRGACVDSETIHTAVHNLSQKEILINAGRDWRVGRPKQIASWQNNKGSKSTSLARRIRERSSVFLRVQEFLLKTGIVLKRKGRSPIYLGAVSEHTHITLRHLLPSPVYIAFFIGHELDDKHVLSIQKHIDSFEPEVEILLLFTNSRPNERAWAQIGTLRLSEINILPIDSTLVDEGLASRREGAILAREIEKRLGTNFDPYDERAPVASAFSFFGRDTLIRNMSRSLERGYPIGLFGLRKMGKSSILQALRDRSRFPVALVNLQTVGSRDLIALYKRSFEYWSKWIYIHWQKEWSPPEISRNESPGSYTDKILELLNWLEKETGNSRLGLFLDEVELIVPSPNERGEKLQLYLSLLRALRGLIDEDGRLSLVVASLNPSITRINNWGQEQNPTYSLFHENNLPPLSYDDCTQMIRNIGLQVGLQYDQESLDLIADLSGGHPFLARQFCSVLYSRRNRQPGQVEKEHVSEVLNQFIYDRQTSSYLDAGIWQDAGNSHLWGSNKQARENQVVLELIAQENNNILREEILAKNRDLRQEALIGLKNYHIIDESITGQYAIKFGLLTNWIRKRKLGLE